MTSFTSQQQEAIRASGNVLVVAGAGTGKTATMVARVLEQVDRADHPVPLDRILMVTFTQKAAAEMRARLRAQLEKRLAHSDRPATLARQLLLLDRASIGTLHGICLSWVREYANVLGLDPAFRVGDEVEIWRLSQEALTSVFEPIYFGQDNAAVAARDLLQRYFDDDESRARRAVLRVHQHMRSLADPSGWLESQRAAWSLAEPKAWIQLLATHLPEWVAQWRGRLGILRAKVCKASECLAILESISHTPIPIGTLLEALQRLRTADAEWPRGRKTTDRPYIASLFSEAGFLVEALAQSGGTGPDALQEDWGLVRSPTAALLGLVAQFEAEFARLKRQAHLADFADIEQFTLALLRPEASTAADQLRRSCESIFVDEYQDINAAQDAILTAVAAETAPGNRFLVGDLKQSIYRFRRADPRLFKSYIGRWGSEAGAGQGQVLELTSNFRSAEAIVRFVNAVFSQLFEKEISAFEYDEKAALVFGAPEVRKSLALDPAMARVELLLQLTGGAEEATDEPLAALEVEASAVAARLAELHYNKFPVGDESQPGFRPVRWGDMAILLRSPGSKAQIFARELARLGIPVSLRSGGFFDQTEVTDLWNLLRILDNPLQDFPVAAVLRSPLAGLRDVNELALLRILYPEGLLWDAVTALERNGAPEGAVVDPLRVEAMRAKLRRLLERCNRWRELARRGPVAQVLEAVLDETLYEALILAGEQSASRRQNIRQLLELAYGFEQGMPGGLARFLLYLEHKAGMDKDAPVQDAAQIEAVRIFSIHSSKGLEFPVTVVAGLGGSFNERDRTESFMIDDDLGIAPVVITPGGRSYPSVASWLAGRLQRTGMLAEELRLLYVAFTRARDLLILSGSFPQKRAAEDWPAPLHESGLGSARRALDWLGPALGEVVKRPDWFEQPTGSGVLFSWRLIPRGRRVEAEPAWLKAGDVPGGVVLSEEQVALVAQRFHWHYPHEAAAHEAAKSGVTELRKRHLISEAEESGSYPVAGHTLRPARDTDAAAPSAADRGTAHHLFLEHVDLSRPCDGADLSIQATEMVSKGTITAADAELLDLAALGTFWCSDLGSQLRAHREEIRREWSFTAGFTAAELRAVRIPIAKGVEGSERIVVQGVIDLAWVRPGEIYVLDFKTDRVRAEGVRTKAEDYRPQLAIYALALERILRRPVTQRWLHFLTPGITLRVDQAVMPGTSGQEL